MTRRSIRKQKSRMAYGTADEALMPIWYFGKINGATRPGQV